MSDTGTYPPPAPEKRSIGAAATQFGLTHRALRYYEQRGLLAPARTGNARLYSERDLQRIATIVKLKSFGFSLTEINDILSAPASGSYGLDADRCQAQIAFLTVRLQTIDAALEELRSQYGLSEKG